MPRGLPWAYALTFGERFYHTTLPPKWLYGVMEDVLILGDLHKPESKPEGHIPNTRETTLLCSDKQSYHKCLKFHEIVL